MQQSYVNYNAETYLYSKLIYITFPKILYIKLTIGEENGCNTEQNYRQNLSKKMKNLCRKGEMKKFSKKDKTIYKLYIFVGQGMVWLA